MLVQSYCLQPLSYCISITTGSLMFASKIKLSMICWFITTSILVMILHDNLPPSYLAGLLDVIAYVLILFIFISLGIITTLLMGNVYPWDIAQYVLLALGAMAFLLWLYAHKLSYQKPLIVFSIGVWSSVGAVSVFHGFISSV